ncbi:MAG: DUF2914 domain-containing protein [Candidatus Neomarinimicrobiota bacterium]
MLNTEIFLVLLATVISIIIAEYQKLRKITWILIIGCLTYILLTIIPGKQIPIIGGDNDEEDIPAEENIAVEAIISKQENIEKIISEEQPSSNDVQNLDIIRIDIAIDIKERTPVGVSELFPNDIKTLFCFTAVSNPLNNNEIIHIWQYEGQAISKIVIDVGASSAWRCWSRATINPEMIGKWQVLITDISNNVLDSIEFSVIPASD